MCRLLCSFKERRLTECACARVCIGARSRVRGEEKGDAGRDRECSTFYVSDTVENS